MPVTAKKAKGADREHGFESHPRFALACGGKLSSSDVDGENRAGGKCVATTPKGMAFK